MDWGLGSQPQYDHTRDPKHIGCLGLALGSPTAALGSIFHFCIQKYVQAQLQSKMSNAVCILQVLWELAIIPTNFLKIICKPLFLSPAPHNQYCCYSREWLLFLKIFVCSPLRFLPFISLNKILSNSSSHNTNVNTLSYHFDSDKLIHNMKIRIRQIFFRRGVPMISVQMGPYAMKSPGSKEQGNVMQKGNSQAYKLGFQARI